MQQNKTIKTYIQLYNYAHTILGNANKCRITNYYTSAIPLIEIEFTTFNYITSVKLTLFRHNTDTSIANITVQNITFITVRVNNYIFNMDIINPWNEWVWTFEVISNGVSFKICINWYCNNCSAKQCRIYGRWKIGFLISW